VDIFAGEGKKDKGSLIDIIISTYLIEDKFYTEIRGKTISKLEV